MNSNAKLYNINNKLNFSEYITHCRQLIAKNRLDLAKAGNKRDLIIQANSPFELYPAQPLKSGSRCKFGVLLIHGLLDCPFSVRDMGKYLSDRGILCRAILLPGHGTSPHHLLDVSHQNWIQAVEYGIASLREEAEHIFLLGYSTGAALSVYHALRHQDIAGLALLAPAIQIKIPNHIIVGFRYLKHMFGSQKDWLYHEEEVDYTRYLSIAYNPVNQVNQLTRKIRRINRQRKLACPVFMAISREDETISSHRAIDFFSTLPNKNSKLLLYTSCEHRYPDPRILTQQIDYPDLYIKHFSHSCIPFSPDNPHYGQKSDYLYASHLDASNIIYGAYNPIETRISDMLQRLRLIKNRRAELTYNPNFYEMAEQIYQFIIR